MPNELEPKPTPSQPAVYQIRLKGHAVWLIAKGFNPSVGASKSGKTATNELLSAA